MAALVILAINVGIDVLTTIGCIYFAITVPQELIDNLNHSGANIGDAESDLRIAYSVSAVVLLAIIGMETFAFIIFRKARLHLIQNPRRCSVFPVTFSGHPHSGAAPVYIASPPYPYAAPSYSAAAFPSGYPLNPPMYPQGYNDNFNLPPRGYNIDSSVSPPMYPQGYPTNSQPPMPIYNMDPVPVMHHQNNNTDSSPTVYQNEIPNKTDGHW
uniref:Uncharacterized protein n=1 Tax=Panagrolaimus superbus TaxID=310955 RepID=A0A914YKZ4_9BILA